MPTPNSSFVIKKYEGFGGNFIDSQYLGFSYDANRPHVFENTLMKMYSSTNRFLTNGKVLTALFSSNALQEIDSDVFRWYLQGAEHRSGIIIEVVEASTAPGLNNTTFRIKTDIDYWDAPDVIMGEDNEYPLEVVSKIADGTGTIYTLRIQTDNPSVFFPVAELQPGKRFDKVWTTVSSEFFYMSSAA